MQAKRANRVLATAAALSLALLAACGGGKGEGSTLTVQGDVAIAYAKRSTALSMNPTDGTPFAAGGDLMLREKSSPSATEHNLTAAITQGQGDVSDLEVSWDGKRIAFSMRCPSSNTATIDGSPACTGRWNLWEYTLGASSLAAGTLRRLTASTEHDDVDPAYLPAGQGFVFSSNRQTKSRINQALGRDYFALDEYERERVLNLHTMDARGAAIQQISFNISHERNPVVRPNGDIMFARWEHVADRNRFAVFRAKPDGTDLFVLYGAQSPGNSFLHPRDMDPSGPYKGYITSSLMPLSGTQEGGALMFIDAANYSENNTPASRGVAAQGGQVQATEKLLSLGRELSSHGRATTPYPLWDGTNRVLVAFRPCEVTRNGVVVPCAGLSAEELASLSNRNMSREQAQAASLQDNAPAAYAIYMFNPVQQTWLNVAPAPAGFMHVDPVALQPRNEPNVIAATAVDADLASRNLALIEVRSVYDTDGLDRMAEAMLTSSDRPEGCAQGIALTGPEDALDTRARVADLRRIKDPADPAYHCAPVRWVRAVRAIAPPAGMSGLRGAIGETDFEQNQIVGYAPVEPDGSFKLQVPADVPLALSILDTKGRAFQTHTNWIQVRPGERRTCDGCHSPRRGASLNSGGVVNTIAAALRSLFSGQQQPGETMASLRTRLDSTRLTMSPELEYLDDWADTSRAGVRARATLSLRYSGNPNPAHDLASPAPVNGVINYPEHIQPLWSRDRGANTCITCHTEGSKLDLRGTVSGTGRLQSYEELLLGDPEIDAATGLPRIRIEEGVPMIVRGAPLVETSSGAANTAGQARKSRLTEILSGDTLLAGAAARAAHPSPPASAPDHARLLNPAEQRLLAEWMDLGGQYYNNPFTATGVRSITGLSQQAFATQVMPVLRTTCASACHQAVGTGDSAAGSNFRSNRFVLTGSVEGDYGSTVSMISDACNPAANALLRRPSSVPHPAGALSQTAPLLPAGSTAYNTIAAWVRSGCSNP